MTKKLLIVLGLTSLLAFTGCGGETQASASTEQVNDDSINWDKVADLTKMNKSEKAFIDKEQWDYVVSEEFVKNKITYRDIRDLIPFFVNNQKKYYITGEDYFWYGNGFSNMLKIIQEFHNEKQYKQHNSNDLKDFLDNYSTRHRLSK